jgi:hypothetical protein
MKAIAGSAVSWPLAALAPQSGRIRRVGVLTGRAEDAESLTWVETFRQRLKELGWSLQAGKILRGAICFAIALRAAKRALSMRTEMFNI